MLCVDEFDKAANTLLDGVLGEITQTQDVPAAWLSPFPVLAPTARPPCGTWPLCTRAGKVNYIHDGLRRGLINL